MPEYVGFAQESVQWHSLFFVFGISQRPLFNQQTYEPKKISMLGDQAPIKPTRLVV
jgi:hypothetical protein